jgi:hypothetical protein
MMCNLTATTGLLHSLEVDKILEKVLGSVANVAVKIAVYR